MSTPQRFPGILFALFLGAVAHADAVVLDWSTVAWTPGSLTNSYDVDGNTANGNDITITITGNTPNLTTDPGTGKASPAISSTLEGGMAGDKSLFIGGNLSTQTNFTVTVTFTGDRNAATGVSFSIFDIDFGPDHEKIQNIYGKLSDGTQVFPTITSLGSAITPSGSDLGLVLTGANAAADTGATSADGNATFSFGNTAISSFTFDFKNDGGPPRFQAISLFDINFTPVPEMNPALVGAASSAMAAVIALLRCRRAERTAARPKPRRCEPLPFAAERPC